MSRALVQTFLDKLRQFERQGDALGAEALLDEQLEHMEFLADGYPDLLRELETFSQRYKGGGKRKEEEKKRREEEEKKSLEEEEKKRREEEEKKGREEEEKKRREEEEKKGREEEEKKRREEQKRRRAVDTYEGFAEWARKMTEEGRLEYALRFLEMAGTIRTLDASDALLAEELKAKIWKAEKAGGFEEATVLVVGQPTSGKSVMLGALWRFLNSHGQVASVSINNSPQDSIAEFYERIMDDKIDSGVFPPGTPPKYNEPIAEFVVDIEPRKRKRGWFKSSKSLPKVRLRLVDIAGEQFSSMGDFSSGEVDPFVTNFLYSDPSKIVILFVIDKDVVSRDQTRKVDRYFTLVRNFMQTKGMDPDRIGDRVGLVLTKWDKFVDGVDSDPTSFVKRFPSSKNIFPDSSDPRIFTFSVGNEYSPTEKERLKKDFEWNPAKAEVLARRLYRTVSGISDDPWVNI